MHILCLHAVGKEREVAHENSNTSEGYLSENTLTQNNTSFGSLEDESCPTLRNATDSIAIRQCQRVSYFQTMLQMLWTVTTSLRRKRRKEEEGLPMPDLSRM